jgi:putative membrane protein
MADPDRGGKGSADGTHGERGRAAGPFDTAGTLVAALRTGRREFERELDGLVLRNRFTVAVVFPAAGALLLVASALGLLRAEFSGLVVDLNFDPYLVLAGVAVMRLPLIAGVLPLVGRRAAAALGLLTLYAYAIEVFGVTTGIPYGGFEYLIDLGPMLGGVVPLGLPVFFFPLVLNSYLLCLLLLGDHARRATVRLPVVVATVVGMDLVLDPAAVALGFWAYDAGGIYYGVPFSNYAGWVVSATVAVAAFDYGFERAGLLDRLRGTAFMLDDLVSFVLLWGPINAFYGNWLPLAVAGLFGLGLLATDRFDFGVLETVPLIGRAGDRR